MRLKQYVLYLYVKNKGRINYLLIRPYFIKFLV